jgi:hypothetical protein
MYFRLEHVYQQRHLNVEAGDHFGHALAEHMPALGARDHDFLDSGGLECLVIQPAEYLEVLSVAGPEQVVAAAALVCQHHGLDAEKIEQAQAVASYRQSVRLDSGKENIEVRRAPGEKRHGAGRRRLEVRAYPVQAILPQIRRGHHSHPRMQRAVVRPVSFEPFGAGQKSAHFQYRMADVHSGRAAFFAYTAGEAFPYRVLDECLVFPLRNELMGQQPLRVLLSRKLARA